jgi:hypothetical protein
MLKPLNRHEDLNHGTIVAQFHRRLCLLRPGSRCWDSHLGHTEGGHEEDLRFIDHHLTWVTTLLRQPGCARLLSDPRQTNSAPSDLLPRRPATPRG